VTSGLPHTGRRPARPPLVARTVAVGADVVDSLVGLLPDDRPVAWLRQGEGIVGWGEAARVRTSGPDRFAAADEWWREVAAHAVLRDEVGQPGSGLVCFGSFAFADEPGESVLVVPEVVVGRRDGTAWVTTITEGGLDRIDHHLGAAEPPRPPDLLSVESGSRSSRDWAAAVAQAVARIGSGELEKVVLARDLVAVTQEPVDVRWAVQRLAASYPTCWTFHVDRLFGATPEMLVRRERGLVTSRVLAGTIRRTGDDQHDMALAATLARSSKDLEEHEYAVRSVADALAPHCSSMNVPEAPFVLHLPNVMHLATDVAGVVHDADAVSSLELAAALHPSAAVGGTPTAAAVALIEDIEGMDRDRYAGPVGWMDAAGDGEWGIALRSGIVEPGGRSVRIFAGCGIVADSDPEDELDEARAKFVPVVEALESWAVPRP